MDAVVASAAAVTSVLFVDDGVRDEHAATRTDMSRNNVHTRVQFVDRITPPRVGHPTYQRLSPVD